MDVTVRCPHCRNLVHIKGDRTQESIQYCGVVKATGEALRDGVSEGWIQYMKDGNKILGCGKPFILVRKSSVQYEAVPYLHETVVTHRGRHSSSGEEDTCECHLF